MASNNDKKKLYTKIAHQLSPVVTLAEASVVEGAFKPAVVAELDRALNDHELIKIKVNLNDRGDRQAILAGVCEACSAKLVQTIGKVAVLLRLNPKPNAKLSNLQRFKHFVSA